MACYISPVGPSIGDHAAAEALVRSGLDVRQYRQPTPYIFLCQWRNSSPHVTQCEQLTLDGRRKIPIKKGEWSALLSKPDYLDFHIWSHDGRFLYLLRQIQDRVGVYRVSVQGSKEELVFDFPEGFRSTGFYGFWLGLDPADAPLLLRDAGTDEIYALTLEQK